MRYTQYLEHVVFSGELAPSLEAAVPIPRQWLHAPLPCRLTVVEVERVLATCVDGSPAALRNHAILLLLVRLGVRAHEVAALCLEDINWYESWVRIPDFLDEQIEALSTAIAASLTALSANETVSPSADGVAEGSSSATAEVPPALTFARAVELLDTIPGVDRRGAELIVAEIGIDMSRFETAPRLAAWAGVAPGNNESAGKQWSSTTRKGNQALRAGLT